MNRSFHNAVLNAVDAIAERIIASAVHVNSGITWYVQDSAETMKGRPRSALAGPGLYAGAAGIALFLLEYRAVSGDPEVGSVATKALLHAVATARSHDAPVLSTGSGPTGVALVLGRAFELTGEERWREYAISLLKTIRGRESDDYHYDLLSGSAGAIPVLMRLGATLDYEDGIRSAFAVGEHLVARAKRRPTGFSWETMGPYSCRQDLTGISHGASGCGIACLELYDYSGQCEFRFAAEQAFSYEDCQFDEQRGNWPDHRDLRTNDLAQGGRSTDEVLAALDSTSGLVPAPAYPVMWCHGAPGIGLARLLAYRSLRRPAYRELAMAAARTTVAGFERLDSDSICHGVIGNAEALCILGDGLGERELRAIGEGIISSAICRHLEDGSPWLAGTVGRVPDPSLFLGEAGVGLSLLRTIYPDLPSVLLPGIDLRSRTERSREESSDERLLELRVEHVERPFGVSLAAIRRLAPGPLSARAFVDESAGLAEVQKLRMDLEGRAAALAGDYVTDSLRLETALLDIELETLNWAQVRLQMRARTEVPSANLLSRNVQLSRRVRLVEQRYDWEQWLESADPVPSESPRLFVAFPDSHQASFTELDELAQALVRLIREPVQVSTLVMALGADGRPKTHSTLQSRVLSLLHDWYCWGLVDVR